MASVLDDVCTLIAEHFKQRGKPPDSVIMPAETYLQLEKELPAMIQVIIPGVRCVTVSGTPCYAWDVDEMMAGLDGDEMDSFLKLPYKKVAKSACGCGSDTVGHLGHSWYCKLYTRNPYDTV